MISVSLTLLAVVVSGALAQPVLGTSCPADGGSFCVSSISPIILSCSTNGTTVAGNCNDNFASAPPAGVTTYGICGNSSINNSNCFLPSYPTYVTVPASSSFVTATTNRTRSTSSSTLLPISTTATTAAYSARSTATVITVIRTPIPTKSTASTSVVSTVPVSGVGGMFVPMGGVCGVVAVMMFGLL